MSDRFRVNIGMDIVYEDTPDFSDYGLTYHNVPRDQMVQLQAILDDHAEEVMAGMKGLRKALVAAGFQQVKATTGGRK